MASTSNEKFRIFETPGITTIIHEMKVNGFHLVERKLINPKASDDTPKMTVFIHSRSIDNRSYTSLETFTDGKDVPDQVFETKMTQEQVKTFEEDWSNLWNPQATADSPHFY